MLARVGADQLQLLTRAGTVDAIGSEHVFVTVRDAVAAAEANVQG